MAFQALNSVDAIEGGAGADLLPPGVYVAVITDAQVSKSKKGEIALLLTWDVAEGEHVGHFGAAQYGHTEWLMLEGGGAPYSIHKLNVISQANSQGAVFFDAVNVTNAIAAQFDAGGRLGQLPAPQFAGRYVGLVVGTEDKLYKGETKTRNTVTKWVTPAEARAGKTADGKDIHIPAHKGLSPAQHAAAQAAQAAQNEVAEDDIPF